jgi:hypothetical protein
MLRISIPQKSTIFEVLVHRKSTIFESPQTIFPTNVTFNI